MRLRELLNEAVNPGDAIDGLVNKIVAYPGHVQVFSFGIDHAVFAFVAEINFQ